MILYPPAKINLGLQIIAKRPDGYHEIATIMAETPLCDIIEITEDTFDSFEQSGIHVPSNGKSNLCEQAINLLRAHRSFPHLRIHLRKQIPVGAGLGGGSADASYILSGVNEMFGLGFQNKELEQFAAELGSDCPFFIEGGIQLAQGRGEILTKLKPFNKSVFLVLCNPQIHVSTAAAYAGVHPIAHRTSLVEAMEIDGFKDIKNDFEPSVFKAFPSIAKLKEDLYELGAVYASMSGSGSSVFGIFEHEPVLSPAIANKTIYSGPWCF